MTKKIIFVLFYLLCYIIGIIVGISIATSEITPMDVYQGKTTLEYTIKDGVVIDSVVVFKNDKK